MEKKRAQIEDFLENICLFRHNQLVGKVVSKEMLSRIKILSRNHTPSFYILKAQLSLSSLFCAAMRSLAMMNSLKSRYPLPSVSRVLNTWSQKWTLAKPGGKKEAN